MSKATAKKKYERMWQTTAEIIREWDPYSLLASGSPRDEFHSEIASVVAQIPRMQSAYDAALALSRTFSSSFESERFTPEACSEAGAQLFERLKADGFLP